MNNIFEQFSEKIKDPNHFSCFWNILWDKISKFWVENILSNFLRKKSKVRKAFRGCQLSICQLTLTPRILRPHTKGHVFTTFWRDEEIVWDIRGEQDRKIGKIALSFGDRGKEKRWKKDHLCSSTGIRESLVF